MKKALILIITVCAAVTAAATVTAASEAKRSDGLRRELRSSFYESLSEAEESLLAVSEQADAASAAVSDSFFVSSLNKLSSSAARASAALRALPSGDGAVDRVSGRLAAAGDYAACLLKTSASGRAPSETDRRNLAAIASASESLGEAFSSLKADASAGRLDLSELSCFEKSEGARLSEAVSAISDYASLFPRLEYDGAFSDAKKPLPSYAAASENPLEESEITSAAASFLGLETLADGERLGELGRLRLFRSGERTAVFTDGGKLYSYISEPRSGDAKISASEAVKIAEDFVKKQGFSDIFASEVKTEDGAALVTLHAVCGGLYCRPDEMNVRVSLSDGEISSFFASSYHTNRKDRSPDFAKTEADAMETLKDLDVVSLRKAVALSEGGLEYACYEARVRPAGDGYERIIVLDASDLSERSVRLLSDASVTVF